MNRNTNKADDARLLSRSFSNGTALAAASLLDRLRFLHRVVFPTWAKGILLRRPLFVRLAERWDLDKKAVRFMQRLRRKYGEAALLLRTPGRPFVILLSAKDMARVLIEAPQSFTPATAEKRAALSHYEPHVSLITRGPRRQPRRQLNDAVLESQRPVHHLAQRFRGIVRREASRLLGALRGSEELAWPLFTEAWFFAVRQLVLGEGARNDTELTEALWRLRANANWVFFRRVDTKLRAQYYARLAGHLSRAEPGSLAEMIARRAPSVDEYLGDQVTQWLFAFDGGAITTFRALALFASHPEQAKTAQAALKAWRCGQMDLPYLRAGFLEAVRLWPTTPVILRESTKPTLWGTATLQQAAGLIIYVPYFHRDDERFAHADRFEPSLWLDKDPAAVFPFVPFSAGPAACPGRHLVAMTGSAWLAALLDGGQFDLLNPTKLGPDAPLPGTLDHFSIRFRCTPRQNIGSLSGGAVALEPRG